MFRNLAVLLSVAVAGAVFGLSGLAEPAADDGSVEWPGDDPECWECWVPQLALDEDVLGTRRRVD